MIDAPSPLERARLGYEPKVPDVLRVGALAVESAERIGSATTDDEEIREHFPQTFSRDLSSLRHDPTGGGHAPLRVGVVLSGGQAPGGHNVLAGLLDGLSELAPGSALVGFVGGPRGILDDRAIDLDAAALVAYRNTGGFDRLGSGRDKIEGADRLRRSAETCRARALDGLVVVGGDDSNTNAAVLAEHFASAGITTTVVGVPKTIDGDLRNEIVEMSFGFDTATKVYAELVGNIARDAASAGKYWHVVKLMGRSASHVTLECALRTQPNVALVGEEVRDRGRTLADVVSGIADVVVARAASGRSHGIVLVPEGLIEFIPEIGTLIERLNALLADPSVGGTDAARATFVRHGLDDGLRALFDGLPEGIRGQLLLDRDDHGNVQVSKIETEKLIVELVGCELEQRRAAGAYRGKFATQTHFFGYEGRCAAPSNFDADYTYALGRTAAALASCRCTGVMAAVRGLARPVSAWTPVGVPITSLLTFETRKGARKPVIRKALVELDGAPFRAFAEGRDRWALEDAYLHPGAIQYWGPEDVCETRPRTLVLEQS